MALTPFVYNKVLDKMASHLLIKLHTQCHEFH